MADKTLDSLVGGDGLTMLAPDLGFIANKSTGGASFSQITFNPSLNPVVLSLTGKFCISALNITGLATSNYTAVLTVDDVIIWNSTKLANTSYEALYGPYGTITSTSFDPAFKCNESLTLQIFQAGNTSATLYYLARPIR